MDDDFKERALPTKGFPKMPKIGKGELEKIVKGEWADLEKREPTKIESRIPGMGAAPPVGGWKKAGLPENSMGEKGAGKRTLLPWEQNRENEFGKMPEHQIGKNDNLFSGKPDGRKTMERRLPGSYMGTQKEQDDITGLQGLIEEAAGKQKNGTQADGMEYNVGNGNVAKTVQMSDPVPQPTPPPGEEPKGGVDWSKVWNAVPQAAPGEPKETTTDKTVNGITQPVQTPERKPQMSLDELLKLSDAELDAMGVDRSQVENARAQQGMWEVEKAHSEGVVQEIETEKRLVDEEKQKRLQDAKTSAEIKIERDGSIDVTRTTSEEDKKAVEYVCYLLGVDFDTGMSDDVINALRGELSKKGDTFDRDYKCNTGYSYRKFLGGHRRIFRKQNRGFI